jgi:hypothetical protein
MSRFSDLPRLSRREWMRLASAGVVAYSTSGWIERLAAEVSSNPERKKSCILLWMSGGPSQMDTFDLKPGTTNGGPFKERQTKAAGLKISEHLPKIAEFGDKMVVIRSMNTKEADHGRATFYMRTGYLPQGAIQYPTLGSLLSKELVRPELPLPNFVAIAPYRFFNPAAFSSGFLGPQYAPLIVGDAGNQFGQVGQNSYDQMLRVQDIDLPSDVSEKQADARIDLLRDMEKDFAATHPGIAPQSHQTAYERAVKLMKTDANKAFRLDEESDKVRDAYGRNLFGQGCLLARRLVERGVPFVEVTHGGVNNNGVGWDTHVQNFDMVRQLSGVLDPAWATLMQDLKDRDLLDSTLIVWMGEFGRTPQITGANGRDHFASAWSTVLAGGGIKGGQAIGKTSEDGTTIEERPVTVPDFYATICLALGIDVTKSNESNVRRPIRIAEKGAQPIKEII